MFKRYKASIELVAVEAPHKTNRAGVDINKQHVRENLSRNDSAERRATEEKKLPPDLVPVRDRMKVYKSYLDKDECMPPGEGTDDFFKCAFSKPENITMVAELMIEYKLPEMYKKILDNTNYSTWFMAHYMKNPMMALENQQNSSHALCQRVVEVGLLQNCVDAMKDQNYMQNYITDKRISQRLEAYQGILTNCVRHIDDHALYKSLHVVEVVQEYLSSPNLSMRTCAIMVVSALISEEENSILEDAGCIPFMVGGVHKDLSNSRRLFVLEDGFFNLSELLECLHRIAVNHANKSKLVEAGLLPDLLKCMGIGSEEEQDLAAKLIWTLGFSESVKENGPEYLYGLLREECDLDTEAFHRLQQAMGQLHNPFHGLM